MGSFAREAVSPVLWCPEGPQKHLPQKHLIPQETKATSPVDAPLKPVPLLDMYPWKDAVQHGKAHQHKLGEITLFIHCKSGGNEINCLVQEPINFTLYRHILCRCHKHISYSIQAWKMVLMLFIVFLLLKQAHLAAFKSILQNLVQGIIITTKPRKLHLPTVKQLFCGWECHDFEVSGV